MTRKNNQAGHLHRSARLFRALAQPSRLLLLRLIWDEPLSGERLTELSGLSAGTVSHHLDELRKAGLIATEQSGYWRLHRARKEALGVSLAGIISGQAQPPGAEATARNAKTADASAATTLAAVMPYGKVQALPKKKAQRRQVLEAVAKALEPGRNYTETEVGIRLSGHEVDATTLRRALVSGGWLSCKAGFYQRTR